MSVNTPTVELNQLIYRHLKENGFFSAAEELQRHSPQEETNISVSLLDIYRSWLKHSKEKKKPNSTKRSKSEEKGKTLTKAKPTTPKKKTDKSAKRPASSKMSTPLKRKKGEETKESAVKAKKSKLSATEKATGGDGSDSDSSLDVEKWKKLILQMTDVDVVKMESINALDSSIPQPKKKSVRKPRAKPPTKTDTPVHQSNEENVMDEETAVTQTPEKAIIKKRRGSAAHVSSETPIKTPNLNKNQKQQRPEISTVSPKKLTQSKDTMITVSVGEEKTDNTASEPKKKKKGKRASEYNMEGDANYIDKEKRKDGKGKKTTDVTEQEAADAPAEENRKRAITETDMENDETFFEDFSESAPQEKKEKKKKKVKPKCEENVVDIEEKMVYMETSELNSAEEIQENSELGVKIKKAKKKKKESADTEENPEEVVQEKKTKKKKLKNPDADILEQEKESIHEKEMSKETGEGRKPTMETLYDIKQEQQENIRKKKKKMQLDSVELTPADQETTSPTKKKKKKNKLKSDEVPEDVVEEATATQTTSDDSHKKKKKSKSSDS